MCFFTCRNALAYDLCKILFFFIHSSYRHEQWKYEKHPKNETPNKIPCLNCKSIKYMLYAHYTAKNMRVLKIYLYID